MKQKDIALIIIICAIAAVVSFFASNALFGGSKHELKAEVVDSVSTQFTQPDSTYFNSEAINPTQTITIGGQSNQNPFAPSN